MGAVFKYIQVLHVNMILKKDSGWKMNGNLSIMKSQSASEMYTVLSQIVLYGSVQIITGKHELKETLETMYGMYTCR